MEQDVCVAKIGPPFAMHECGRPCEYLTTPQAWTQGRGIYSGWYHLAGQIADLPHWPVPGRMIR